MASRKQLEATAREQGGKGAARAVRRAGKVPGVIYGDKKDPISIALDAKTLTQRIYAGHFLTTLFDLDVDGTVHQVIPRDYQRDPVSDRIIHVDFLRLKAGQTIRVEIPVHFVNHDASPGLKRGGTLNVVRHTVEMIVPADDIPEAITGDLKGLDINDSLHISAFNLPAKYQPTITDRDFTVATIAVPAGFNDTASAGAPEAGTVPTAKDEKAAKDEKK